MAKMFYTMGETAQRLGMSSDEVMSLVESRQLEEFKDDAGNLIFKVQQVDLLAGDETDSSIVLDADDDENDQGGAGMIPLADSGELEPLSLASSGTGVDLGLGPNLADESAGGFLLADDDDAVYSRPEPVNERTGVNIFDPDDLEQADPSAQTQLTAELTTPEFDMDAAASGSGLYDLTSEGDESIVGGPDMLDDLGGDDQPMAAASSGSSALFDPVGSELQTSSAMAGVAMVAVEPYDGVGSGLGAGMAGAAVVACTIGLVLTLISMLGGNTGQILSQLGMADNAPMIVAGAGLGMLAVFTVVGLLLLRKGG